MRNLAYMYEDGKGVLQDYLKAADLLWNASRMNDPKAEKELKRLYDEGLIPGDYKPKQV